MTYATTGNASLFFPVGEDESPEEAYGICVEQPSRRERELHKRTPAPQTRPGVTTTHGGNHE